MGCRAALWSGCRDAPANSWNHLGISPPAASAAGIGERCGNKSQLEQISHTVLPDIVNCGRCRRSRTREVNQIIRFIDSFTARFRPLVGLEQPEALTFPRGEAVPFIFISLYIKLSLAPAQEKF